MDTEVAAPAAPAAPDAPQPTPADVPEPMDAEQPTAEEQKDQPAPEAAEQMPAADDSTTAAAGASEPAPSPSKQKKQAKPRAAPKPKETDMPQITPGSRERKKVDHFKPSDAPAERKAVVVQEGNGTKLRDIPNVHFKLSKIPGREELMEQLHDVMYKRKGQASTRKRDILDFSGFSFAAEGKASELEKVAAKLGRLKTEALNQLLDIFELPRGTGEESHKEAKIKRISDWLLKPEANSTKDLAAQAAKKRDAAKRKREREEKAKEQRATKKAKATNGKVAKKTPAKKKSAKKAKKEEPEDEGEEEAAEEEDSDDDLPLGAVAKMPTDSALVKQVEAILASVDVQEFNLKALMAQLAEHYGTDMAQKKPLIKRTAIEYCLSNPTTAPDDAEEAPALADEAEAEEAPVADVAEAAADEPGHE